MLFGNELWLAHFINYFLILLNDTFHNYLPSPASEPESFDVIFAKPLQRNGIKICECSVCFSQSVILPFRIRVSMPYVSIFNDLDSSRSSIEYFCHLLKVNYALIIQFENVSWGCLLELFKVYVVQYAQNIILIGPGSIFFLMLPKLAECLHSLKMFCTKVEHLIYWNLYYSLRIY